MRILLVLIAIGFTLSNSISEARCNGGYADHLIRARFTDCARPIETEVRNWDENANGRKLSSAVSGVCGNGCYLATEASAEADCTKKYAEALQLFNTEITAVATRVGCKSNAESFNAAAESVTKADASSEATSENSCEWVIRMTADLKCGGSATQQDICGVSGRAICVGEVVCNRPFKFDGKQWDAGGYDMSCLSDTGYCTNMSIEKCFGDKNIEIFTQESYATPEIKAEIIKAGVK